MPLHDQGLFELVLGDVMSSSDIAALGATEAAYVAKRTAALNAHWTCYQNGSFEDGVSNPFAGDWDRVDYYDRAATYYSIWKGSGYTDTTARDRARAIAAHYIDNVTNGFTDYNIGPYNQQVIGAALYYADTGSSDALTFVGYMGDYWRSDAWLTRIGSTATSPYGYDGRTTARGLVALATAHLCNAPALGHPNWGAPSTPITFQDAARQALDQILAGRNGNGIWRYPLGSSSRAKPWMIFMILDALIYYDMAFEADARIAPAIQTAAEYLFTGTSTTLATYTNSSTFWNASAKAFYYLEGPSTDEPATITDPPGVDLDGLCINAFAYTYSKTSASTWSSRAQLILEGLLGTYDELPAQKQVNQAFALSYKTFPMLQGAASSPGNADGATVTVTLSIIDGAATSGAFAPGQVVLVTPSVVSGAATGAATATGATKTVAVSIVSGTAVGIVGAFNKTLRGIAKLTKKIAGTRSTMTTLRGRV